MDIANLGNTFSGECVFKAEIEKVKQIFASCDDEMITDAYFPILIKAAKDPEKRAQIVEILQER